MKVLTLARLFVYVMHGQALSCCFCNDNTVPAAGHVSTWLQKHLCQQALWLAIYWSLDYRTGALDFLELLMGAAPRQVMQNYLGDALQHFVELLSPVRRSNSVSAHSVSSILQVRRHCSVHTVS